MMLRGGFVIAWVVAMSGAMGLAQAPAAQVPAAQAPAAQVQGAAPAANGPAPMLLWANGAPGALGDADDDKPTITAYIPASNPTKTAVVIAPGGSYMHLSLVKEGSDVGILGGRTPNGECGDDVRRGECRGCGRDRAAEQPAGLPDPVVSGDYDGRPLRA